MFITLLGLPWDILPPLKTFSSFSSSISSLLQTCSLGLTPLFSYSLQRSLFILTLLLYQPEPCGQSFPLPSHWHLQIPHQLIFSLTPLAFSTPDQPNRLSSCRVLPTCMQYFQPHLCSPCRHHFIDLSCSNSLFLYPTGAISIPYHVSQAEALIAGPLLLSQHIALSL